MAAEFSTHSAESLAPRRAPVLAAATQRAAPWAGAGWQRVRWSVYLAFLLIGANAVLQAWQAQQLEGARLIDAEIVEAAGQQGRLTQRLGRLAALMAMRPEMPTGNAAPLAAELRQSMADALRIESQMAATLAQQSSELRRSLEGWQTARERLWYRAEALLGHADAGRFDQLRDAAEAVQAEADRAAHAAQGLVAVVGGAARDQQRHALGTARAGAALTLLLLGLLALAVVGPAVRSAKQQGQRLADQLRENERLALVAEHTGNLVVITDSERHIVWANQAFTRLTGYELHEVLGRSPGAVLQTDRSDPGIVQRLRTAFDEGRAARVELLNRSKDGRDYWIDADIQPLRNAAGELAGFIAVATVITEQVTQRRLHEQLRGSARSDPPTQLPNRTAVLERVQRAIEHRKRHPEYRFAVLLMDVDRFEQVNDTLGRNAGDELLRQVAARLVDTLRPGDSVARVGGDEFVIVLEGLRQADDARGVADHLLEALAEPFTVAHHPVHASVSIGIVADDHAGDSADAVLRDCDTAMYEAKRAGRGRCVVFDKSMHERVMAALEIERDLRLALERGELFAEYQPVVQLDSRALAGVEALVRWQHPQRGVVLPGQFIALAEERGLIDAVGRTVLRLACAQFGKWQRELGALAPPLVSVNLWRAQLEVSDLVAEVAEVVRSNGMQPAQLQFEVTEPPAAQDEHALRTLRELKALGVRLALDDFGTGYSSLASLHQLPVDTVKIDRSFVAHASDVEHHRVLIEATIRVARTLGMTTVAEGIELDDQAALMQSLRCDHGQGDLFGQPMKAEEFERWSERVGSDTVT